MYWPNHTQHFLIIFQHSLSCHVSHPHPNMNLSVRHSRVRTQGFIIMTTTLKSCFQNCIWNWSSFLLVLHANGSSNGSEIQTRSFYHIDISNSPVKKSVKEEPENHHEKSQGDGIGKMFELSSVRMVNVTPGGVGWQPYLLLPYNISQPNAV